MDMGKFVLTSNNYGENIAEIIKTKRIEKGLTQRDIAIALNVTEPTVSRWESGKIESMRGDKLMKLVEILSIDLSMEVPGQNDTKMTKDESLIKAVAQTYSSLQEVLNIMELNKGEKSLMITDAEEKYLIRSFRNLTTENKKILIRIANIFMQD